VGRVARVEKTEVIDGVRVLTVDAGSGASKQVDLYLPPGVDAMPLPDDLVILINAIGNDGPVTVAVLDEITPDDEGGWHRLYSRNSDGAAIAWVRLKSDGSLELANENGIIEMASNGTVSINGNLEVLP